MTERSPDKNERSTPRTDKLDEETRLSPHDDRASYFRGLAAQLERESAIWEQRCHESEAEANQLAADLAVLPSSTQSPAEAAIREHNAGCDASCDAQRATDNSTGCGYQNKDGSLIYKHRNCPHCPKDWKIEFPLSPVSATHSPSPTEALYHVVNGWPQPHREKDCPYCAPVPGTKTT